MYICEMCKQVTEDPRISIDCDTGYIEKLCPHCNSMEIAGAAKCISCSAYITNTEDYCTSCMECASKDFSTAITDLTDKYGKEIIKDIAQEYVEA